ncbi:aspartyl-phosphate phosphatase Spo0E family protein [Desulfosporosinus fructosivorans]|uniref:Aspartyl-phosphate phosphatase Spo0E family protein n=1 Tax=Desulfosporosinus fructosivorans TaxID=2018669 RepID=A0A4Z0RCV2_9FIRM|nr:aspartyl-phosphate phosphatase Spo0E family protein [Desulfosporosinus fructosivorans]TGE39803.1 aspartyl-phosphate phosphatase Spo0E family protein [Desulfosporosinus fructosivorans]
MSEIEELINRIEELRLNMIQAKEGRNYTDPEVIATSQALDDVLDKYQEMIMKKAEQDDRDRALGVGL